MGAQPPRVQRRLTGPAPFATTRHFPSDVRQGAEGSSSVLRTIGVSSFVQFSRRGSSKSCGTATWNAFGDPRPEYTRIGVRRPSTVVPKAALPL